VDAGAADAGLDLTGEHGQAQAKAMRKIGTGGRVGVLVGAAGAGKSTLLSGLVRAWAAQGRESYGTATAWRQAQALSEAGIPPERCLALAALLARVRAGTLRLDAGAVILVDEMSLVSAEDALALLEWRGAVGCTLIAVGDDRQGRSVQAGGVIGLLGRALNGEVAEVTSTVRQRTIQERELTDLARAGRAADVLDVLRDHGRARLAPGTLSEAAEAVADLWQERAAAIGEEAVLVVAPTREDCRTVGAAIRQRRRAAGRIGPDIAVLDAIDQAGDHYALPIAIGDPVRLYGRTHVRGAGPGHLGVNGSIVVVCGIKEAGIVLRSATGREGLVPWGTLRDRETGRIRLDGGSCCTITASQGETREECLIALPRGSVGVDAGAFYVAATRHRTTSWLIVGEAGERRAVAARRSLGDARPIRAAELWSHAAAVFSRRPGSEGALDLLDRAAGARHACEDGFRRGLARIEARVAHEMAPTILLGQGRRHRLALALEPLAMRLAARAQVLAQVSARVAMLSRTIIRAVDINPGAPEGPHRTGRHRARAPAPRR
jgi:hypothetical protein